jgi:hypothetical protein
MNGMHIQLLAKCFKLTMPASLDGSIHASRVTNFTEPSYRIMTHACWNLLSTCTFVGDLEKRAKVGLVLSWLLDS